MLSRRVAAVRVVVADDRSAWTLQDQVAALEDRRRFEWERQLVGGDVVEGKRLSVDVFADGPQPRYVRCARLDHDVEVFRGARVPMQADGDASDDHELDAVRVEGSQETRHL